MSTQLSSIAEVFAPLPEQQVAAPVEDVSGILSEDVPEQKSPRREPTSLLDRLLLDPARLSDEIRIGRGVQNLVPQLLAITAVASGLFGLSIALPAGVLQASVAALKVPIALLVAAGLSLPILHVSCALTGFRIAPYRLSALVLQSMATSAVTMAGLAPLVVVVWLTVSADACVGCEVAMDWYAYRRVLLASVGVAGLGALAGAARLLQVVPLRAAIPWAGVFGVASLQMGWLIRPIVGMPNGDFVLVRSLESNALTEVLVALWAVLT